MKIDRSYISSKNTYPYNNPQCIAVHNTDNFEPTAMPVLMPEHSMTGIFLACRLIITWMTATLPIQAAPHNLGCWHVGINYGNGNLFGSYGNRKHRCEMCAGRI